MPVDPSAGDEPPFLMVGEDDDSRKELTPIYSALTKRTQGRAGNLTCSGSNEFCFLCAYTSTEDCEVDLRAHIQELAGQGQEVVTIANAVSAIYNEHIRHTVAHERADGTVERSPRWSVDSIRRHLLLSPEYESVFNNYQHFLFKSIILRQADKIVDDEGDVDSESTKQLLSTLRQYADFRQKGQPAAKRQCRSRNETPS